MRVLAFTATYGAGPRPETLESVAALAWDGRLDHEVSWHNPYPEGDPRNVTAQMVRGRRLALEGRYDAMLVVEHDMRVPANALQRLWDIQAPVAYGVYVFRHGVPILNTYEKYPGRSRNMGESLTVRPALLRRAMRRGVVEVSGVGFGCTLIRRAALEALPFRNRDGEHNGTDVVFSMDCLAAGFRQMADFGVPCGHWDGRRWLEPFGSQTSDTARVRALQDVTVRVHMETRRLRKGQYYDLPADEVSEIRRGGYVALAGEPAPEGGRAP
jgi:hypothetical protein